MSVSELASGSLRKSLRAHRHVDDGITEQAENRLRANAYLALKNISCEFRDGVLTLNGRLPTYYLKQIAQETVAATEGVTTIANRIEVCQAAVTRDVSRE